MGRPRKRPLEEDLTVAVEDVSSKSPRPMIDAEHTIKYRKPIPDPAVELTEEDPEEIEEIEEEEEEEGRPKRRGRNASSFRAKLKQELSERGIGGEEQLRLRVDRLPYYDIDGRTGLTAEKEFVRNFICQKDFVLSDEYLDEVAKLYGPGAYWFTLRHKTSILKNWHMKIGGAPIAPVNTDVGQTSSQVSYQPNQPQQHFPVQDPLAHLRQAFKLMRDFREDLGLVMPQPSPAPAPAAPTDPKLAALQLIAENPDVMEKIGSGIAQTVLGSKSGGDSDPWATVAMEAIKSGQASQIVATLVREIMSPFRSLWGNNNGGAQVAQAPVQNQTRPEQSQQQGQLAPGQEAGGVAGDVHQHGAPQNALEPADELIYALIGAMERQASMAEAQSIVDIAVFRTPELRQSIDELINLPSNQILALVTAYHPPVAQMSHAPEWLEALITMLTVNNQEEGSEE